MIKDDSFNTHLVNNLRVEYIQTLDRYLKSAAASILSRSADEDFLQAIERHPGLAIRCFEVARWRTVLATHLNLEIQHNLPIFLRTLLNPAFDEATNTIKTLSSDQTPEALRTALVKRLDQLLQENPSVFLAERAMGEKFPALALSIFDYVRRCPA